MISEKQIQKWNDQFKAATKAEKRILIAKDVISNLRKNRIVSTSGTYLSSLNISRAINGDESLQKHLDGVSFCRCCAMGACLISAVKYKNTLTVEEVDSIAGSRHNNWSLLKGIFTPKQLLLIEDAFEGNSLAGDRVGEDFFHGSISYKKSKKCNEFYKKYPEDNKRLKEIMKNIIANEGTFVL